MSCATATQLQQEGDVNSSERSWYVQSVPALESDVRRCDSRITHYLRQGRDAIGHNEDIRRGDSLDSPREKVVKNYGLRAVCVRNVIPGCQVEIR
jgi:hypothetical protein